VDAGKVPDGSPATVDAASTVDSAVVDPVPDAAAPLPDAMMAPPDAAVDPISGRVTDHATGQGVAGATVTVYRKASSSVGGGISTKLGEGVTDDTGQFVVAAAREQVYVRVAAPAYLTRESITTQYLNGGKHDVVLMKAQLADGWLTQLSLTRSSQKSMIVAEFATEWTQGGEEVRPHKDYVTRPSDTPFSFDDAGQPVSSKEGLAPMAMPKLWIIPNLEPTPMGETTAMSVGGPPIPLGSNTKVRCSLASDAQIAGWVFVADVVHYVPITCTVTQL
jgi:hypothetical protein